MEEPLLFIPTPPFYYIEVEGDEQQVEYEESTSVYEITRTERIKNPVIARQLNFFSQPLNSNRILRFYLSNGESITGKIEEVKGNIVKVKNDIDIIEFDGNLIEVITTSR